MAWSRLGTLFALFASGCGSGAAVRPAQPAIPYDATVAQARADFVESSTTAPFVMHWEPWQSGALDHSVRKSGRIAVVHYEKRGLRLLNDCRLNGSYTPTTFPPYRGSALLSNHGELSVPGGPVGGASVAQGTLAEFEYVVSGKLTSSRESVAPSELQGDDCSEATHFVRGAYTGAFRRGSLAKGSGYLEVGPWVRGSVESREQRGVAGGSLSDCTTATESTADSTCSAIVRLELEPVQPSANNNSGDGSVLPLLFLLMLGAG